MPGRTYRILTAFLILTLLLGASQVAARGLPQATIGGVAAASRIWLLAS